MTLTDNEEDSTEHESGAEDDPKDETKKVHSDNELDHVMMLLLTRLIGDTVTTTNKL